MIRRLLKHPGLKRTLARLLGLYLALTYRTIRWQVVGLEHTQPHLQIGGPFLLALWHERLAVMPQLWAEACRRVPQARPDYAPHVLTSRNRDGEIARAAYGRFGFIPILGSSSKGRTTKGGTSGVRTLLQVLKDQQIALITPDGPRGPRRQAAPGIAHVAQMAQVPLYASAGSVSRAIRVNSWDKMMFPLPFCRGALVILPVLPPVTDRDSALVAITAALNDACTQADRLVGRPPDPA